MNSNFDNKLFFWNPKIHKSMKSGFIIFILLLSSFQQGSSQGKEYANEVLKVLCSEEYHGRGYAFGSDKKTTDYIIKELKKSKVKAFNKEYKQAFNISVNTLPGNIFLQIGHRKLEPGVDYLTASFSNTVSGKLNIVKLNASVIDDSIEFRRFIKKDFSNKALLIDTVGLKRKDFSDGYRLITERNILKAKVVIRIEDSNLIYTPSQIRKNFSLISIKRNAIPANTDEITIDITSKYFEQYETNNIIGYLKGQSDSSIVLSAHYDHIGHMGLNTFFPGANDNGSGVAMLLNLAKHLAHERKLKYNIVFMFFSGEELGLLGSKYYTENPVFPISKIKFLINLDMVGSGDEGIKVVNGSVFKDEFQTLCDINQVNKYLPDVKIRGAAANSDHYFFYEKGVRCFFIYTLGKYKEYHNINDKPENLPLNEFDDLSKLLIDFINTF
ncbi:MAG: Zn-dependent exopeptidase M28 [Bacteroidales bacterium]|nr:Zn-dependent exopeptidase M28 [Bacteroidales bacterium]